MARWTDSFDSKCRTCGAAIVMRLNADTGRWSPWRRIGNSWFSHFNDCKGVGSLDPYAALFIRRDAPLEVAEAAYRALAKRLHPDAGGDKAAMQTINGAIEQIRSEHN